MPSRNSFSIRKLFTSPRRLSLNGDETASPDDRFNTKRRSDVSASSGLSSESRRSTPSRGSTASGGSHGSHGSSSSSTIFHPDSSISITTPQAERGLTDNVDHELSQEEIDRIKAVVAAAAAAAASSLRLRMDEDSGATQTIQTIQTIKTIQTTMFTNRIGLGQYEAIAVDTTNNKEKKRSESTESTESAEIGESEQNTENTNERPQLPRKKNRRIPQPIVVPPRPTPRTAAGARPPRRSIDQRRDKSEPVTDDKDDKNCKTDKTEKGDTGDKSDRNDRNDEKEKKSQHHRPGSQGSQRSQGRRGSLLAKSSKSQQHLHHFRSRSREAATGHSEQRKTGRSDKGAEQQKQHETGATLPTATAQVQVQVQLAAGNSQASQTEGDKRDSRPKHSQTFQTAPKNKQSSQDRQDEQDKQKDAAADERRAAWPHGQNGEAVPSLSSTSSTPSTPSTPMPSSVAVSSRLPPSLPSLPLYTTVPRASIVSSLPARAPDLLSKALPPPPPPRVSSYFATRSSWKPKTEKSLLSLSTATNTPLVTKSKSKPEVITPLPKTADAHFHPLYRGQNGEPDCKKDSGIALDRSQTSLVGSSSGAYDTVSDTDKNTSTTNNTIVEDIDSDSDAGSCIDLLQALAILPEEADLLRRQTADSTPASMMHSASLLTVDGDTDAGHANANAADGPALRDICTTPTFTQPRVAPTPSPSAVPSAVPSEANTPRRMMSPSPSPRPSFMGPTSRTSGTFSALSAAASPPSPKKQTRFLPLRLNKGLPDAALRIQRKRSKKAARKRDRAASNTKGQPFSEENSQLDAGSTNTSRNNNGSNNANNNGSNTGGGSSRWTLPDNVTELFNGRLFSRLEVTETLPFEKLQAIRESRALAQKQQEEAEEKKKSKQLQDEQDQKEMRELQSQKQQQDLIDAERALIKELQQPQTQAQIQSQSQSQPQASNPDSVDTAAAAPLETLLECEEEELQVSPLEPEDVPVDAEGNPIESDVSMPVSPPAEPYPLPSLPMPPHIASQMVWPGGEDHEEEDEDRSRVNKTKDKDSNATKTKTLFLSAAHDEPDGSTTPIEPFHMEDLPSRIGAAGVRVSILLPVKEEEAYFASSVAQHKERRRREKEEQEREEEEAKKSEEDAANLMTEPPKSPLDEIGPFPSPPTKNPMRFQSFIKKTAQGNRAVGPPALKKPPPTQPIPQVTVTDVDSQSRRRRPVPAKARKLLGKTPKSSFFLSSSSLIPPSASSSLSVSSSTSSMAAVAATASAMPQHRDEATYVYLSATPFSLVMPTYRHGPIRLNRSDLLDAQANSRNSYDRNLHHHHHHPNIATVDDTLDWTAFQMAILGGAGDFFQDSIDYGQISAAETDEADRLADWFWSLDIKPERLLTSPNEDKEWVRAVPPPSTATEPPVAATVAAAPATLTHHTQRTTGSQWTSISSSAHTAASSMAAVVAAPAGARSLTHSRTTTSTSIGTTASGYSSGGGGSSNRDSAVTTNMANNTADPGLTTQTANLALPFSLSRNNSTTNSLYAMGRDNISATNNVGGVTKAIPPTQMAAQPRTIQNLHAVHTIQDVRASYVSVASYESMPQSPMADLIITRGADGKEYVAPMGYNLSHDLGDYLQWEKDNVYAVALEEPR